MTYVIWDDGRDERPPAATVTQPETRGNRLAKMFADADPAVEWDEAEDIVNRRVAGARRRTM